MLTNDAGACDLVGIILERPFVERRKSRLDFSEALIDLFGEFVGFRMVLLETIILSPQGFGRSDLLVGHRDGLARDLAQPVSVAVGKVECNFHPFPFLRADRGGLVLQPFRYEPVEQHGILQPTTVVLLEEIPHDVTAGRLIDVNSDELAPACQRRGQLLQSEGAERNTALCCGTAARLPTPAPGAHDRDSP